MSFEAKRVGRSFCVHVSVWGASLTIVGSVLRLRVPGFEAVKVGWRWAVRRVGRQS